MSRLAAVFFSLPKGIYCYQMTRRTLAKLAAGSGVLYQAQAQQAAAAKYPGALDGFENKVDVNNFDPVYWGRKLHEAAPLRMTFKAANRRQAEEWQKKLRPKIVEMIGGFPEKHA